MKRLVAARIRAAFRDPAGAQPPVQRRPDGLFGPSSTIWRVHGDVASMMVGGLSALLLQMLHPAVLAGVWDHSTFRNDMRGRLSRTARFIALTTYGSREEAETAIERVRTIHRHVHGTLPDGTPYRADDPALLAWVHATEAASFLGAWIRYVQPGMRGVEQDRYLTEIARIARSLGADPVPATRAELSAYIAATRPRLRADERTAEVARLILHQPAEPLDAVPLHLIRHAAVDLLPPWARQMHGLTAGALPRPLLRAGTFALARTTRWALR
ncbi:conserved hypothetical protein [Altererythrobacter sp. B11]|uniref:oxygenase MpaB family protein n=1 Tax=Altererythrobacter sp. B11 TaxID=2060312 RepID=UPI000DC6DCA1|nr:oxygenase MpaB family protein [Altererythrobacter sp. B11]BBC73457.1 conserved hypothetical protein [Altererythrobacter sp. B11]